MGFLEVLVIRRTAFGPNVECIESLTKLAQAHAELEGLLLAGGLHDPTDHGWSDEMRGQALSGQ